MHARAIAGQISRRVDVVMYRWRRTVATSAEGLDSGHVVQFYGREEDLADQVAGYLLGALRDGGVAVVIATAAHRQAFEGRLAQAGVDLAAAARDGRYQVLDAGDAVRVLTPGGRPDPGAFDRLIGGLIRRAVLVNAAGAALSAETAGATVLAEAAGATVLAEAAGAAGQHGRPVRAYGEMVALLWDAGLVNAAVELEEMWNSLGAQCAFSLFCGYPASSVSGDGQLEAFTEVCRLHRSVVGGWPAAPAASASAAAPAASADPAAPAASTDRDAARAFAFSADAPAAARHFAVDALRRLGAADLTDDTALVVTELAANAIVHAQTGFTVNLSARPDVLRISVRDASPAPPAGLPAAPLHGLGAVDMLASRWGVEPVGHSGKSVWVELRR
jgi:DcmR-like sensory protein